MSSIPRSHDTWCHALSDVATIRRGILLIEGVNMHNDFDKIVLSDTELELLNYLLEHNAHIDEKTNPFIERLTRLNLAEIYPVSVNGKQKTKIRISSAGKDYLMYLCQKEKEKRISSIRYWITTAIALIALIKSFTPEILSIAGWLLNKLGL